MPDLKKFTEKEKQEMFNHTYGENENLKKKYSKLEDNFKRLNDQMKAVENEFVHNPKKTVKIDGKINNQEIMGELEKLREENKTLRQKVQIFASGSKAAHNSGDVTGGG